MLLEPNLNNRVSKKELFLHSMDFDSGCLDNLKKIVSERYKKQLVDCKQAQRNSN